MSLDGGPLPRARPPWDWSAFTREQWLRELERLGEWVDWLQQAYRVVELPRCWPCHEGLRRELALLWYWWLELHEPRAPEEPVTAAEGAQWHDHLRQAAATWREYYAGCSHENLKVDEIKHPLDRLAAERRPYMDVAWRQQAGPGSPPHRA